MAEEEAGENENEQRSAVEVLLCTIDGLTDEKLTRFALRLALAGHQSIPRESEFDFLTEAESVFVSLKPGKPAPKKSKRTTPIKEVAKPRAKLSPKKATIPKKKIAA